MIQHQNVDGNSCSRPLFISSPPHSWTSLTRGRTAVVRRFAVCERQSGVFGTVCECVCVPHTFLCQHNASSCDVYFMLCCPSPRVESQQPSNIHTAGVHLHIKRRCSAKSTWTSTSPSLSRYHSVCFMSCSGFSAVCAPPPHTPHHHLFVLILFC